MMEQEYDHALVLKAIKFAAESHYGAIRKGTKSNPIPYIVHPMEAAAIVASMTNDPDVIAAAMLHDVVEDTDVTIEEIKAEFNERVAQLVAAESEDKREDLPSSETWKIRKWETIEHLKNLDQTEEEKDTSSVYIKMLTLADKLSNIRAMKVDYAKYGDELWERFNQKDPEMQAWYYRSLREALDELQDYEAWTEYNRLVEDVFWKYKEYSVVNLDKFLVNSLDKSKSGTVGKISGELKIRWDIFKTSVWLFSRNYIWRDNIVQYKKIKCPVCGTKTLDSYWICPRCHWEYEDYCEENPDLPNGSMSDLSLNEYRQIYKHQHK